MDAQLLALIQKLPPIKIAKADPVKIKETEDALLQALNIIRKQNNLEPLSNNSTLNKSALNKAIDLVSKKYWAHRSPEGVQPWEEMENMGYQYKYAGENLARGFTNDQEMVEAWMNSPTHKDNILSKFYTELGVGRRNGHVVTHFGKPSVIKIKGLDL